MAAIGGIFLQQKISKDLRDLLHKQMGHHCAQGEETMPSFLMIFSCTLEEIVSGEKGSFIEGGGNLGWAKCPQAQTTSRVNGTHPFQCDYRFGGGICLSQGNLAEIISLMVK